MAPIGERRGETDPLAGVDGGESQNLWATILSEVQSSSASKLSNVKSILVIGDTESGKTTLIAKLQGNEDPRKGSGLEYYNIDVKDEYRDDQARLGVWILDGDTQHTNLLKYALTEENFAHTLVLLVVSMAQPWNIMDSLQKWITVLRQHIEKLKIPKETLREYEQSLVRFFQEYTEPEEGGENVSQPHSRRDFNPLHPSPAGPTEEENVLLPLPENTLNCNLGIPVVVVVTKTDGITVLEKEHDYKEEHFDFIQQHLRKFCLNYGAALIYTSVKEEKNCDLLFKYLVHRIYGFSFSMPAYVVEKDSVFVPAGWDTEKKISILNENLASVKPEDLYEDVLSKPVVRKPIQKDAEVIAEDEQVFLMRQQSQLAKQPAPGCGSETPLRSSPGVSKGTPSPRASPGASGSPTPGSTRKLDSCKTASSEGMLANFFNSLLSKKTGTGNKAVDKAAVTRDAAAELERLNRTKKTVNADGSTGGSNEPSTPT